MIFPTLSIWYFLNAQAAVDTELSAFIWTSAWKGKLPALLFVENNRKHWWPKTSENLKTNKKTKTTPKKSPNPKADQHLLKAMLFQSTVKLWPMNSFLFVHLSLQLHLLYILETALKASLKTSFASDPIYYLFKLQKKGVESTSICERTIKLLSSTLLYFYFKSWNCLSKYKI